jgi:hypothetical protein
MARGASRQAAVGWPFFGPAGLRVSTSVVARAGTWCGHFTLWLPRQLAVRDPMWAHGGVAEGLSAPLLVLGEVAVEEGDLGVALEGEDVRGDAVEEPAVVGDPDDTAGDCRQCAYASRKSPEVSLLKDGEMVIPL